MADKALDLQQNDGDVVATTGVERQIDQLVERVEAITRQAFFDKLFAHGSVQAVGRQQNDVAQAERVGSPFDLEIRVHAHGAGDDMAQGMHGGFLMGDPARFEQFLDRAMIARQAIEHAVTENVGPAVTGPDNPDPALADQSGNERRAHRATGFACPEQDVPVGYSQRFPRPAQGVIETWRGSDLAKRADRTIGDVAAVCMATHAVGDDDDAAIRGNAERVFVFGSHETDVAEAKTGVGLARFRGSVFHDTRTRATTAPAATATP